MKVHRNGIIFEIRNGKSGLGVFTTKSIKRDEVIFKLSGSTLDQPTQTSIQIGHQVHVEDPLGAYVNHHCQPATHVDRDRQALVAIRDLAIGDEITFDYNANEDSLASSFTCSCCKSKIEGKNKTLIYE